MSKKKSKKESSDEIVLNLDTFAVPGAIILAGVIIAVAVFISNRNGGTDGVDTESPENTLGEEVAPEGDSEFATATTDLGDAPYLGNRDTAKLAVVEFSDYRCGYCERHKDETLPSIVENYVDSGDIIYVYRDFPIYGDDINNGARCVFNLEGIDAYKEFHDKGFNLEDDSAIYDVAKSVGVNESEFDSCYSSTKYQDQVDADLAAGQSAGIQGTPGFVIGTLDADGQVTGVLVPGAYPYETFEEILNGYLSE
jgi:protein-disulfide isomerase